MNIKGINQKEYTIGIRRIYYLSLLLIIPISIFILLPYIFFWSNQIKDYIQIVFSGTKNNWNTLFFYGKILKEIFIVSAFVLIGAVFHELLHAVFWIFFTKKGVNAIRFGFTKSDFSPYIHCEEPLQVWVYRTGIILPGIILGFIPAVISIFTGNFRLLVFGVFFLWAASGDFLVLWLIRNLARNKLVQDHPEKVGCLVVN